MKRIMYLFFILFNVNQIPTHLRFVFCCSHDEKDHHQNENKNLTFYNVIDI